MILLSAESSHHDTMVRLLIHIGCDRVNGYLDGDINAWERLGLLIGTSDGINLNTLKELSDGASAPMILDVRQRNEYHSGHIQGALNIELGKLQEHLDGLRREIPVVTVCAAGMRASMAGSILQRAGREKVRVLGSDGTQDWIDRGYRLPPGTSKPYSIGLFQVWTPGVDRL